MAVDPMPAADRSGPIAGAEEHDLLTTYTVAMRWVVIPLTVLTLAVVLTRELKARRG